MSEADKLVKVEKVEVEKEHAKTQAQIDADRQKVEAEKKKAEAAHDKAKKDAKNEAEKAEKEKEKQKTKAKEHEKDLPPSEKKPYEPPKRFFDMNRDTAIRYFGYGHEVGNCARGIFGCATRYLTLLPAWGAFTMSYIVRDAYDRSRRSYVHCPKEDTYVPSYLRSFFEWLGILKKPVKPPVPSEDTQRTKACIACGDALLWQGLASLLIPALLMRNTQYYGRRALCSMGANKATIRFVPTLAALSLLPLLGQPIDHFVDNLFDNTYRYWFSDY